MKTSTSPALSKLFIMASILACAFLLISCANKKRVDWNSRIGSYTYDQAVADMGPPDKQATLSDGRTVAEWITHRSGGGLSIGTGFGSGNVGVGVGQSIGSGNDHTLKLIFNKEGRLGSWSKN